MKLKEFEISTNVTLNVEVKVTTGIGYLIKNIDNKHRIYVEADNMYLSSSNPEPFVEFLSYVINQYLGINFFATGFDNDKIAIMLAGSPLEKTLDLNIFKEMLDKELNELNLKPDSEFKIIYCIQLEG